MQAETTPHDEANTNGDGHDDPSETSTFVVTTTTSFEGATLEAITAQCCAFPGAKLSELRYKVPEIRTLFNGDDPISALGLAIEGTPSLEVVRAISDGADYVWTKELGEAFRRVQTKTLDLFQMMGLNRIVLSQLVLILQKYHSQPQDREDIRALLLSGQVKQVLQEMPSLRVDDGDEGEGICVYRSKSDGSGLQKPCSPMQAETTPHDEANTNGDGHDDSSTSSDVVVTTTTFFEGATLEAISAQCCAFPGAKLSELRLKVPEVLTLFNGADQLSALRLAIKGTPSLEVMHHASNNGEAYVWTKELGETFRRVEAKIVQLFDKIGLQRLPLSQLVPQLTKHYPQPQERKDVRNILMSGEQRLKWVLQKMPSLQVFKGVEGEPWVSRASSSGSGNVDTSLNAQGPRELICLRRTMLEFKYHETKWPGNRVALQQQIAVAFTYLELKALFPDADTSEPRKLAKYASKKLMMFIAAKGFADKLKGNKLKWNERKALSVLGDGSLPPPRPAAPPAPSTVLTRSLTATNATRQVPVVPPPPPPAPARVPTAAHQAAAHQTPAVVLVDSYPELERAASEITAAVSSAMTVDEHGTDHLNHPAAILAVDCEGVPEELILVQVAVPGGPAFVFDCLVLGPQAVCAALAAILADRAVLKLFHDLHMDAAAFAAVGGLEELNGTLDTQLVVESLTGELHIGMNKMLQFFGSPEHPGKAAMKRRMQQNSSGGGSDEVFSQRPLPHDVLMYAAQDVSLLVEARSAILEALDNSSSSLEGLRRASDKRAATAMESGGLRQVAFDLSGGGCRFASRELLEELRPEDMCRSRALEVSNDSEVLLSLLPDAMAEGLRELPGGSRSLSDICLDKGRRPYAWVDGRRVFLLDDDDNEDSEGPDSTTSSTRKVMVVEPDDIEAVVEKLGGFGSDDRAGLEQQLHRVSGMRNRDGNVIGLTMRVGRHVGGNADMIVDLLLSGEGSHGGGSILILGQPGCGKTTIVRSIASMMSELFNVCIIDTSNEIAGDGDVPHPCVGLSRRMMVPTLDQQSAVMIQCVQNHTPDVMVIDEIGRPSEVEAARTCKQRGVRMVASAHGDLRKLIKNRQLRGLVGGVETVTLGDKMAKEEGAGSKLKAVRGGEPTFDAIVELERGRLHCWRVIKDVAGAVDAILEGRQYPVQLRTRDPETGHIHLELDHA